MRDKKFSSIGRVLNPEVNMGFTYKTERTIKEIVLHCSASPQGRGDDAHTIDRWHLGNGWSGIGYHYVVLEDGTIQKSRWADSIGAHVKGHNKYTIGICWIGGTKNDATPAQIKSLKMLSMLLISDKMYKLLPEVIKGHNEYAGYHNRGCPMLTKKQFEEIRGTLGL